MPTVVSLPIHRSLAFVVTLALVLAAMAPLVTPATTRASTHVWINEIHYDNASDDAGEAIEVAGSAGTDLAGWSLVLYNGNGGAPYGTLALSGSLPDQQDGFGTTFVAAPGLQNGSPDGIALVDNGTVVQFLSYEGEMTAVGGPADGMTSVNLPVAEGSATAVGASLQLTGQGTAYADFSWDGGDGDLPNTFGEPNAGQTFGDGSATARAVINEFSASTAGTDTEFIEVLGPANADLSDLSILEIEGEGAAAGTIDEVVTVGTTDGDGRWIASLPANTLENGTLSLLLVAGFAGEAGSDLDANDDGAFDSTPWIEVLDAVAVKDADASDITYATPVLGPNYDGVANFAPGGASRIPDGTDTDAAADWVRNDFDLAGIPGFIGTPEVGEALNTPGAVNAAVEPPPVAEGIVISQLYGGGGADGASYTNDFVELHNTTDASVDLSGWSVQHASAAGDSWGATALSGSIAPGGYYLVQLAGGSGGGAPLPTPDATGSRNIGVGSGKLALVTTTAALSGSCPIDVAVDFVGYGATANCFEGAAPAPPHTNTSATIRLDDGTRDTDDNGSDFTTDGPTPRNSGSAPAEPCVAEATPIHEIQGSGLLSPLDGQVVTIQGVVVGDFQNNAQADDGNLGGFFVQEEDADADADSLTSEGIFVFGSAPDVTVGAVVRVTGTVDEFGDGGPVTELTGVSRVVVCQASGDLPQPAELTLPVADPAEFEHSEGMLVTFTQALTISEYFNYDRFGEIVLTVDRDHQPTAIFEPGSAEAEALAHENRLNRITLDDGQTAQNPSFVRHPNGEAFTLDNRFRGGDSVANVTGVIDHSFGLYRIQPTQGAEYAAVNPRPVAPADVGGSLTVASFNVLNYFTTIDLGGQQNWVCGPLADQECRGADDPGELARQRAKIVAALVTMDADVVGLVEIENHPGDVPTADLVAGLNDVLGAGTYDYVATGAIGSDAIRVALIYKPASVTPVGDHAILDSSVDPRFDDGRSRPVLAQAFAENASGAVVTVAVNHLKSKGSDCGGPPDDDPVQGNCNLTRTSAAEALVDWLATDPTDSGDLDALVIGDLNSYDLEDPIDRVRAGPDDEPGTRDDYTDLVLAFEGPEAYSYVFDGQLGYLDHALASATLASQVTGATAWHINADEPDLIDYDTSFKSPAQDAIYAPDAYRSSDHDPVLVGLDLTAFGFGGLQPPIRETNAVRAGSAVPVKFALAADPGTDVLHEPPQVYACGEWPLGDGEDADSADGGGLRYDPETDEYTFVWKTSKALAGDCALLVVTLGDGTYATATFEFR